MTGLLKPQPLECHFFSQHVLLFNASLFVLLGEGVVHRRILLIFSKTAFWVRSY